MRTLVVARHGESEHSLKQLVNGDPGVACPLTAAGREQARALGTMLAGEAIDLCAVTEFERVRETAEIALGGRDVPLLVVPELNDPRYGEFEGGSLDAYREWVVGARAARRAGRRGASRRDRGSVCKRLPAVARAAGGDDPARRALPADPVRAATRGPGSRRARRWRSSSMRGLPG